MNRFLLSIVILPFLFGSTVQATPDIQQVRQVAVVSKTSQSITIQWKAQTTAKRYQIKVVKHNGKLLKKVTTTHHQKTIKGLQPNRKYRFKVRAKAGASYGAYSAVIKARTKVATITPGPTPTDPGPNDNSNDNTNANSNSNNNTNANSNTNTNTNSNSNSNNNSNTNTPAPTPDPILIGFWGLNGYVSANGLADVQDRFHSTVFQVAQEGHNYTVNTFLPMVQAAGMKVTLRLSGGHSVYTTSGNFDLAKWKTAMDGWSGTGIETYITNGTLVGHMILDDIDTFSGTDPTAADLEEMARYSKEEVFPRLNLMTFVRQKCSNMPVPTANAGQYLKVDNCVNQYTNYPGYSDGPIATYVTQQTTAATALGLGMINGLNIADGGDGSSGQPGATTNHYAMSASEITTYGEALLAVPTIDLFLMWEYDGQQLWSDGSIGSTYFDHTDVQAALAGLGTLAAARTQ